MKDIKQKIYDSDVYHTENGKAIRRPLMIGCSGGGGHIAAIRGLEGFFETKAKTSSNFNLDLTSHKVPGYSRDFSKHHPAGRTINNGLYWMSYVFIRYFVQKVTAFPVLPEKESLFNEIETLSNKNRTDSQRTYIDMLLDVYPAGFESAAIWNVLQREDKTEMLKRAVALQNQSDNANYNTVKQYYFELLKASANAGKPYTEVISTQAMSLPGLCDAIIQYNDWIADPRMPKSNQYSPDTPRIAVHQYMTDLPTQGAVHYFNALKTLSSAQQEVMKLYGLGLTPQVVESFVPSNQFAGLYDIPSSENPMIRAGFKNDATSQDNQWDKTTQLPYKTYKKENGSWVQQDDSQITITPNAQVGSIMLGSQASDDTVKYVKSLLEANYDHVFVFGGLNENIYQIIESIINTYPKEKQDNVRKRIHRLGNQSDKEMQPIMTRSNTVFIRGGGLSVMEQMAMKHNPQQSVFIHHPDNKRSTLSSGISWEDENVNNLISFLNEKNIHAKKTSPNLAANDLADGQWIAMAKKYGRLFYNDREKKEYIGRTQAIHQKLDQTLFDKHIESILGHKDITKAVSKLAVAGPVNNKMLKMVINDDLTRNKLLQYSEIASRTIGYLFLISKLGKADKPKYRFKNDFQIVACLVQLYSFKGKTSLPNADILAIKKELLAKICFEHQLPIIDTIIESTLQGTVKNQIKIDLLDYRCSELNQVVQAQSRQNNASTLEKTTEITLQGIKKIIETTHFSTGLLGLGWLGGDKIRCSEDADGLVKTNTVPKNMRRIHDAITKAEDPKNDFSYRDAKKEIERIVEEKLQEKGARVEYRIFKSHFGAHDTNDAEHPDSKPTGTRPKK